MLTNMTLTLVDVSEVDEVSGVRLGTEAQGAILTQGFYPFEGHAL